MAAAVVVAAASHKYKRSATLLRTQLVQLPPEEKRVREGKVEKRVLTSDGVWHRRRLVLTDKSLCVAREESEDVLDLIPLTALSGVTTHTQSNSIFRSATSAEDVQDTFERENGVKPEPPRRQLDSSALYFEVSTKRESSHHGRTFHFRASAASEVMEWSAVITHAFRDAQSQADASRRLAFIRKRVREGYESGWAQAIVAILILGNFAVSVASAQLVPEEGSGMEQHLEAADLFFTAVFTVELAINLFGHWFTDFWRDGWNVFDFVIVLLSIVSIPLNSVPGVSQIRLMRVFRVVRIFELMHSLRKIIVALSASIIPVLNAFLVLALVTSIYAIIGVSVWRGRNEEMFGNFSAALFTLFQVCTGDGWATSIARPMFGDNGGSVSPDPAVAIFFLSYILIVGTFLLNVVIAVLLDEFISSVQDEKARKLALAEEAANKQDESVLDPLMSTLACFNTPTDLKDKIRSIYKVLDSDDSGGLSFSEMRNGLRKMDPPIHLTAEDFEHLLAASGTSGREMSCNDFEETIRTHLAMSSSILSHREQCRPWRGGRRTAIVARGRIAQEMETVHGESEEQERSKGGGRDRPVVRCLQTVGTFTLSDLSLASPLSLLICRYVQRHASKRLMRGQDADMAALMISLKVISMQLEDLHKRGDAPPTLRLDATKKQTSASQSLVAKSQDLAADSSTPRFRAESRIPEDKRRDCESEQQSQRGLEIEVGRMSRELSAVHSKLDSLLFHFSIQDQPLPSQQHTASTTFTSPNTKEEQVFHHQVQEVVEHAKRWEGTFSSDSRYRDGMDDMISGVVNEVGFADGNRDGGGVMLQGDLVIVTERNRDLNSVEQTSVSPIRITDPGLSNNLRNSHHPRNKGSVGSRRDKDENHSHPRGGPPVLLEGNLCKPGLTRPMFGVHHGQVENANKSREQATDSDNTQAKQQEQLEDTSQPKRGMTDRDMQMQDPASRNTPEMELSGTDLELKGSSLPGIQPSAYEEEGE